MVVIVKRGIIHNISTISVRQNTLHLIKEWIQNELAILKICPNSKDSYFRITDEGSVPEMRIWSISLI